MEILREISEDFPVGMRHDYIVDGSNLVAFRTKRMKNWKKISRSFFDKRRRQFENLEENIPDGFNQNDSAKKVIGSKGDVYYITDGKCSCPGFTYRGSCKHMELN